MPRMDREVFEGMCAYLYKEPEALATSVDLSTVGIVGAWARSIELCDIEPHLLVVAPNDYHLAEQIIASLPLTMKCIMVVVGNWLAPDAWVLGNINAPGAWVGSEGA